MIALLVLVNIAGTFTMGLLAVLLRWLWRRRIHAYNDLHRPGSSGDTNTKFQRWKALRRATNIVELTIVVVGLADFVVSRFLVVSPNDAWQRFLVMIPILLACWLSSVHKRFVDAEGKAYGQLRRSPRKR